MWEVLPIKDKQEYKRLILAFASLTKMFTQKVGDNVNPAPIINSKFQETVFQKAFHAFAEDIGNTSYDVSLRLDNGDGTETKCLIGIKTFGLSSGDQKVAQFKTNHGEWSSLIDEIEGNARCEGEGSVNKSKEEIDILNHDLYLDLAKKIATIRNQRIITSQENLRGFDIDKHDDIYSIYHVLMPSKKGETPKIFVGETSYNKIDIDNISIHGCTSSRHPSNFIFDDGNHTYKYTAADRQLQMKFNNLEIVVDEWDVVYAEDAYSIFSDIANNIYGNADNDKIIESYSWSLLNNDNEVEMFSGLNNFYGVGPKLARNYRIPRVEKICRTYENEENLEIDKLKGMLTTFMMDTARTDVLKKKKAELRNQIICDVFKTENEKLINDINKLVYRPVNELYIPIPNSKKFHNEHPNFFGNGIGKFEVDEETGKETKSLKLPPEKRKFTLVFEPSGDFITAYITQDYGKAIQSLQKQSYLGEWILRRVFQLKEYELLTKEKLEKIGINGIRLYKKYGSNDIHLKFIWIDSKNFPDDFIQ